MKITNFKVEKFNVWHFCIFNLELFRVSPSQSILNDKGMNEYPLNDDGSFRRYKLFLLELQIGFWVIRIMMDVEGINLPHNYEESIPNRISRAKSHMEKENARFTQMMKN